MLQTIKEVATRLQIKPSTLYAWAAQERIPCLKIHGLVRFRKDEIVRTRAFDIDHVIARAKRGAYNPRHGETRLRSSPIGKEDADGAV
jgi:excisionase family DNA binding protein